MKFLFAQAPIAVTAAYAAWHLRCHENLHNDLLLTQAECRALHESPSSACPEPGPAPALNPGTCLKLYGPGWNLDYDDGSGFPNANGALNYIHHDGTIGTHFMRVGLSIPRNRVYITYENARRVSDLDGLMTDGARPRLRSTRVEALPATPADAIELLAALTDGTVPSKSEDCSAPFVSEYGPLPP